MSNHIHKDWKEIKYGDKIIEFDNHFETSDGAWITWAYSERFTAQRKLRYHPNKENKRSIDCKDVKELKERR